MPDVVLSGKPHIDMADENIMKAIHEAVHVFQHQVDTLLEETLSKPRTGDGPLAEIKYWKERDRVLSGVVDQLHDPKIKYVLDLHLKIEMDFEFTKKDLIKYAVEAHDNVRFLSTLERHFRNIKYGTTFQTVTESLAPMMNAMRMIWIISRHYNTDELMVPLMSRIAWELCERVARVVNVTTLFKLEPSTIKKITSSAVTMLDTWKSAYLFIRAKIETSGRGVRWEFDRKKLFDRSEYMATICRDLHDIAQVIEEFLNIFSQELKNVTGDAGRIDEVVDQVYELVEPISQLPYDAFSPLRASSWNSLKTKFYKRVTEIEQTAKLFIDDSFQSLRSSEGAFELLMKLKSIKSRESVNQKMQSKFRNVIMQFNKEIDTTSSIFMESKAKPPLFRNYPPVSGCIYWERFMVYRIKDSIIRFQSMHEMMSSDLGKMVQK
ncbi:dynein heavy chain 10, axonemal-like [Plakobranchus ocellatus]|uniref:Dynein heavy chain 10, axonemal-like n=1 Tax=Plakobranchus ocellatus TaxID=259542 RepID=A0AAV4AK15_9GAST|nr:dynein heavy chain 10, axonemal-like [Plakobranchus ocellatus]